LGTGELFCISIRRGSRFATLLVLGLLLHGDLLGQGHAQPPTKIFVGVTYGAERLALTEEGGGLVHWVQVDLTAPGLGLYVTPLDPDAVERGWQYRLRSIEDVVEGQHLSVAVNATYFDTASGSWLRFSGELARSLQTLISDHVVAYGLWGRSLIWFDTKLAPHVSPPGQDVFARAHWGIGTHELQLHNGQVLLLRDSRADARTAIGVDQTRKLLFLAVAERLSQARMMHILAGLGARDGFLLDGGNSSAMGIGEGSNGIPGPVFFGARRPVATYIGVRALPCRSVINDVSCY
jgi:hypothetical protein